MKTQYLETLQNLKKHIQDTQHRYVGYTKGTKSRFGFLETEDGQDIFIPPYEMDKIFPGDRICLLVKTINGEETTTIEEILEHNFVRFVGIFTEDETGSYVIPEDSNINKRIRIPKSMKKNSKNGCFVKAEMIEQPCVNKKPKARILSVVGDSNTSGIENDLVIAKYGIPYKPSFNARKELLDFNDEKEKIVKKQAFRKDLTNLPFLTIDGESTMDIDDAIFAEKNGNQWKLFVAISDVSEFVVQNSAIDRDAFKKTTSVYFTGKMLPMLPNEISTETCSFKESETRMAMIAEMDISENGELLESNFYEAYIESKAKMSYLEVEDFILNNNLEFVEKYGDLSKQIFNLYKLHETLNHNRQINYIIPEFSKDYKLMLDIDKKIKDIQPMDYKISNKIIEECMIIANIAAAQFLKRNYKKAIYKSHKGIDIKKLSNLKELIKRHFSDFNDFDLQNIDTFKDVLQKANEIDNTGYLKSLLILYMNRSEFSTTPESHFGLGFEEYTYFTSPNRRYPDIVVHRMIKAIIHNKPFNEDIDSIVDHLNQKNKEIEKAINEADSWLKCIYINNKRNHSFTAKIYDSNESTIMLEIIENGIKGILPVSILGDVKKYDNIEFIHNIDNVDYKINHVIDVKIKNINFQNKTIIFKKAH
jgi:ribonuclease R